MPTEITESPDSTGVRQFSIFGANKVGALHSLVTLLASRNVHVIAITAQDATDSAICRIIVDDHEMARELLVKNSYAFTESQLTVVELSSAASLPEVTGALLAAEINIHYIYPFIVRPGTKSALAIHLEDNDLAETVLTTRQLKVLRREDLTR